MTTERTISYNDLLTVDVEPIHLPHILLACPFCGGVAVLESETSHTTIACVQCTADCGDCDSAEAAIARWNSRTTTADLQQALKIIHTQMRKNKELRQTIEILSKEK